MCRSESSYVTSDRYRILSIAQISSKALFIDMFKFGRIVSLDYPHETLAEFGNDGVRCIIPIRYKKPDGTYINLIVCGCEKRTLEVYELVETQQSLTCRLVDHHDLNCQPRALAYNPKKKLLSLTSFGILFEVYALTYEGDGPKLTLVFREGLHLALQ